MTVYIHQAYHQPDQIRYLDKNFIPYDNKEGDKVLLEYGIWKNLYPNYSESDAHWGTLSWKYRKKINISSEYLIGWISSNPGYDVYYFQPYLSLLEYKNLWIQGEEHHPGIINFCDKLLQKLGYNFSITELEYTADEFATCHYHIGNNVFWSNYLRWLDDIVLTVRQDAELNNFMFNQDSDYKYIPDLKNVPFIVERLFTLFLILHPYIKAKHYPYESNSRQDSNLDFYYARKQRDQEILEKRKQLLNRLTFRT